MGTVQVYRINLTEKYFVEKNKVWNVVETWSLGWSMLVWSNWCRVLFTSKLRGHRRIGGHSQCFFRKGLEFIWVKHRPDLGQNPNPKKNQLYWLLIFVSLSCCLLLCPATRKRGLLSLKNENEATYLFWGFRDTFGHTSCPCTRRICLTHGNPKLLACFSKAVFAASLILRFD